MIHTTAPVPSLFYFCSLRISRSLPRGSPQEMDHTKNGNLALLQRQSPLNARFYLVFGTKSPPFFCPSEIFDALFVILPSVFLSSFASRSKGRLHPLVSYPPPSLRPSPLALLPAQSLESVLLASYFAVMFQSSGAVVRDYPPGKCLAIYHPSVPFYFFYHPPSPHVGSPPWLPQFLRHEACFFSFTTSDRCSTNLTFQYLLRLLLPRFLFSSPSAYFCPRAFGVLFRDRSPPGCPPSLPTLFLASFFLCL